jgi:hypothetical protein
MRLKTKYRQAFKDGGRVDLPGQAEMPIEPAEAVAAEPPPAPSHDDATLALQKQIEGLRRSEEFHRQQAAQAAMSPPQMTREQRLAAWRQHGGLSDAETAFFQRNSEMVDFPEITGFAVKQAQQAGLERGTDAHFDFVKKSFDAQLNHLQAQAADPAVQPSAPTPQFFKPTPPGPAALKPSGFSAPVSRDVPSSSGQRLRPKQVTLTPAEVEAARIANISVEEYARQKVKYETMREDGSYRDNRDQQR